MLVKWVLGLFDNHVYRGVAKDLKYILLLAEDQINQNKGIRYFVDMFHDKAELDPVGDST